MNLKPAALPLLFLFACTTASFAQEDSIQNLYFVKRNRELSFGKNDYKPGKNAFYIYRNCIYDFVIKNKKKLSATIIDIRNDSIYYTSDAATNNDHPDTLCICPSELKRIKMVDNPATGLFLNYSLRRCRYQFEKTILPKTFNIDTQKIYSRDSSHAITYRLVPHLTIFGINMVSEEYSIIYYKDVSNQTCKDSTKKKKDPITKKGVWFTPSYANRIKGVNIGLQTINLQGEPLTISGVNFNADVLSFFLGAFLLPYVVAGNNLSNLPDTLDKSDIKMQVSGLSLSVGGLVGGLSGNLKVQGISINGGICTAMETNGLLITGSQNITDEFNGAEICILRNRAIKGKGVQVGLLNICKHMKGIQVGLWNVNSKRRLPFINWSF